MCALWGTFTQNFDFNLRRDYQKEILWASRLWVDRRKEPISYAMSRKTTKRRSQAVKSSLRGKKCNSMSEIFPELKHPMLFFPWKRRLNLGRMAMWPATTNDAQDYMNENKIIVVHTLHALNLSDHNTSVTNYFGSASTIFHQGKQIWKNIYTRYPYSYLIYAMRCKNCIAVIRPFHTLTKWKSSVTS